MKDKILNFFISMLPRAILFRIRKSFQEEIKEMNSSYSQNGEDMILRRMFYGVANGFYVDVGAHHPKRFSNTYAFYKRGWRGINIDAMPGSMESFNRIRPEDTNLEVGVSTTQQSLSFYVFNEPALNTFNHDQALAKSNGEKYHIVNTVQVDTFPLSVLLDRYLKPGTKISLLTIDVEGLDMQVLQSNDWGKYLPDVICVEVAEKFCDVRSTSTYQYLNERRYKLVSVAFNSLIFVRENSHAEFSLVL